MKFAIVGAGAIGAFAGAMLAKAGEDVTLIARGPHLRAMQERGNRSVLRARLRNGRRRQPRERVHRAAFCRPRAVHKAS